MIDASGGDAAVVPIDPRTLRASYEHCRQVARLRARNFYYGLALTPSSQRSALYAVYAFMRACDDLADASETSDTVAGIARIESFRRRMVAAVSTGSVQDVPVEEAPIWPAFIDLMRRHPIDVQYLHAMLDGQCDDLQGRHYDTFEQTRDYCYKVAGTVGLVCISVWGYVGGAATRSMAVDRGLALQLTNMLRDLVEDHGHGRSYLPNEEFQEFGFDPQCLADRTPDAGYDRFMAFQIERIRSLYAKSAALDSRITPSCRPTSWAIMEIYRRLFEEIASDPRIVLKRRVSLRARTKMMVVLWAQRQRWHAMQTVAPEVEEAHVPCSVVDATARGIEPPLTSGRPKDSDDRGSSSPRQNRPRGRNNTARIAVIGGGLAGIAAAVRLVDAGQSVTLVETSKRLGGRATSFVDPASGLELDNCQHVLMGCCTHLMALYKRLGVAGDIGWHRVIHFSGRDREGQAVIDHLEADDLPAPAHLVASIMGFRGLRFADKMSIARGMIAMMRLGVEGRRPWHDRTFAQWLEAHGQPRAAIEKFWSVVIVSALNERVDRVAADVALQVFQEGFLANEDAYLMGVSKVPLVRLYDAACDVIATSGGRVLVGCSAERIVVERQRVVAIQLGRGADQEEAGGHEATDACISAVPFDRLHRLVPEASRLNDDRLGRLTSIDVSPILGIHLWFQAEDGEPVMTLPHLVVTEGRLQWIFNKGFGPPPGCETEVSRSTPCRDTGVQHLHGVISAARDEIGWPAKRIETMAVAEVREILPRTRIARLVHAAVIKERRATFSAVPGISTLRPPTRGLIGNLYLAGDWCQTGWPATMEGAVRSGDEAAKALLEDGGGRVQRLPADLPASSLYTLAAGR